MYHRTKNSITGINLRHYPPFDINTGLMEMKAAKLCLLLDNLDEAKKHILKGKDILEVTHGKSHQLITERVRRLEEDLEKGKEEDDETYSKSRHSVPIGVGEEGGTKIEEGIGVDQVDVEIPAEEEEEKKKFDVLSCKHTTSRKDCETASDEQVKEALKQWGEGGRRRRRGGTKRKKSKRKKSKHRKSKRRKKSKKSKKAKKSKKSKHRRKSKKRRKSRRKSKRRR